VFFVFLDHDHAAAVREAREHTERYTRLINSAARDRQRDTPTHQPKSTLFALQERILSTSDHVEERAIVGTPSRVIERIGEINEIFGGLDEIAFYPHAGGRSPDQGLKTMRLFAEEVMPAFRVQ
jgi:alkanesulfonate monooxygenase SsuD/methylene tetrahydromethanopterin reductase-like flavin-dependent oxidoreductase (luciferase family)